MDNGRAVDLDAILTTKSGGAVVPATQVVKKAGFFKKLLGGSDEVSGDSGYTSAAGVKECYYFGNKFGKGVKHHGDDRTGAEDEGEYIEVDLDSLPADIDELVFSVISFSGHSFGKLPFASINIFTGSPSRQGKGLVSMELTGFASSTKALVLAKVKKNAAGEWEVTGLKVEGTSGSVSAAKQLSSNV